MKSASPPLITRRICLYGSSVIMGSLAATLRRYPQLEISTLPAKASDAPHLEDPSADVVLFDLEASLNEEFLRWIHSGSMPLLIGVSSDANVVKLWSGLQLEELSTNDLMDVIERHFEGLRDPGIRGPRGSARRECS